MVRRLRKYHFYSWRLIAVFLPIAFVSAIIFRPDVNASRAVETNLVYVAELDLLSDSTAKLRIKILHPLQAPSCLVMHGTKGNEVTLGLLSGIGEYNFPITRTGSTETIRFFDPIYKKDLYSINLVAKN